MYMMNIILLASFVVMKVKLLSGLHSFICFHLIISSVEHIKAGHRCLALVCNSSAASPYRILGVR